MTTLSRRTESAKKKEKEWLNTGLATMNTGFQVSQISQWIRLRVGFSPITCYNFIVDKVLKRPLAERIFTTFIGIDLGGGKGKNTAIARLEKSESGVRVVHASTKTPVGKPYHDPYLVEYLMSFRDNALCAIDAPLMPSVCFRCRREACPGLERCEDPVVKWFREKGEKLCNGHARTPRKPLTTAYTQRACEIILHKIYGILPRETLGQGMGPLTARAHYLRRTISAYYSLNQNLIEVYPKATVFALFGSEFAKRYKREVNTWQTRAIILESLKHELQFDIWREKCLQNDHCFDAVLAAYTGYLWARQGWTLPETDQKIFEEDGWIWFPPIKEFR